jgi:hypothetical protein
MSSSINAYISFDDDVSFETMPVTPLSSDKYRLEATPLANELASFGDVIQAKKDENGRLRFEQVVSHSGFQKHSWLLARPIVESPEFEAFCEDVMRKGGMWEKLLGGLVIVHTPPNEDFNPEVEMERLIRTVGEKGQAK